MQALIRILVIEVPDNADRASIAGLDDSVDHLLFMQPGTDGKNLVYQGLRRKRIFVDHTVEINAKQVGLHQSEVLSEAIHFLMGMVKIVNDAHIVASKPSQRLADSY